MTKQEFEIFLDAKASEAKTQNATDRDAQKKEWLRSLKGFYEQVELWLADYLKARKIAVKPKEVTLEEEHLGKYRVKSLELTIGVDRAVLRPIGTILIGAHGRVDMEGPKGTVKFVLTGADEKSSGIRSATVRPKSARTSTRAPQPETAENWVWRIATPPPKVQFLELTSEAFFDALMEVVNG